MFSFTLDRDDLLRALEDVGVSVPSDSKITTDALTKRLERAINIVQSTATCLPKDTSLDVFTLGPWPQDRPLLQAVRRGSLHEVKMVQDALRRGENPAPLYKNSFMDLRQTLMSLGNVWDTGIKTALIQDLACETSAIHIRVRIQRFPELCRLSLTQSSCRLSICSSSTITHR